jgi:hypothetical protein
MFGRNYHVSCTKQCIGTGSVNAQFFAQSVNFEIHFSACRFANPVALHIFYTGRPVKSFESPVKAFQNKAEYGATTVSGFCGLPDGHIFHAHHRLKPLRWHKPFCTNRTTKPARYRNKPDVCRNIIFNSFFSFIFNFFRNWKFRNWSSFLLFLVEPGIVKLFKNPLCPFKIFWVGGVYFAVPVVTQPNGFNLPRKLSQFFGGNSRVSSGLNGILFSRKSKSIISHRDASTLKPFIRL